MEYRVNQLSPLIKVLVVDDQPLIVEELCEFLESSGYRCVPCESSREAIECFNADPAIGLVLCDLHMPDMNGIELTQHLQKHAGKQRLFESILLTGRADKQDVIKALRIGIADYYQKPVDLNELLEGIQRQEEQLRERMKSVQLGHLNRKLQFLADSIDDLYQDMESVRQPPLPRALTASLKRIRTPCRRFSSNCHRASSTWPDWWAKARPTTRSPATWASRKTRSNSTCHKYYA